LSRRTNGPIAALLALLLTSAVATAAPGASMGPLKVWVDRHDWLDRGDDTPSDIALAPDGSSVYVTGTAFWESEQEPLYGTLAMSAVSGQESWEAEYDSGIDTGAHAYAVAVSPDSKTVFVTGKSVYASDDMFTIAYDKHAGAELWEARYEEDSSTDSGGVALAVSLDGTRLYVAGYAKPQPNQ